MKTCTKCQLPKKDFPKEMKRGKLVERAQCTDCRDAKNRAYYAANALYFAGYREAHREKYNRQTVVINRNRRHERYAAIKTIKEAAPCMDCGRSFPYYTMDFDHRDRATKVMDVSLMVKQLVPWGHVLAEIAKCDLVCVRCHRLRTYHGDTNYRSRRFKVAKAFIDQLKTENPCKDCEGHFEACQMDFDHTGEKYDSIAGLLSGGASLEGIKAEIAKCDLVCANCHRERTQVRSSERRAA